jgi:tRNA-splicing ligase RtcB
MPERRGGEAMPVVEAEYDKARRQVGTLGGGNHFIEIQRGSDGRIWAMVHSGSRNIGKQVADHYNKLAVKLNEKWKSDVPKAWQLAFLPLESDEGRQYLREMTYCVAFAQASRALMLERVQEALREAAPEAAFDPVINIAHNYAAREKHYGREVVVHRKGATQAQAGQQGIIPGSQGAQSYIVRGKGNRESFMSCSHGAGRRMGRKQAMRELDLKKQQALLESQGIVHGLRAKKDLDEAPGAYKDIAQVMRNQQDLVDIETELTPLAALKA